MLDALILIGILAWVTAGAVGHWRWLNKYQAWNELGAYAIFVYAAFAGPLALLD